jgi:hypothetical protein
MTLLTICRDVATDMGIPPPVAVFGSQGVDERRLLRFASRVGRELATRCAWQALRQERTFTASAAEEQANAIPVGFLRFSPETLWDRTHNVSVTGPIDPTEYQSRRNDYLHGGLYGSMRWFTRRGDALLIVPPPQGGEQMAFEYQSADFCQSAGGTPQSEWLADTDTGRISEELITLGVIHRFLEAEGQPSIAARADFERRLAQEIQNDAPGARVLAAGDLFGTGRRFTGEPGSKSRPPASGFGGDGTWGGGGTGVWG